MNEETYKVVFSGEIADGFSVEDVRKNLSSRFKLSIQDTEKLFSSPSIYIKRNVNYKAALKFQQRFEKTGALCTIVPLNGHNSRAVSPYMAKEIDVPNNDSHPSDLVKIFSVTSQLLHKRTKNFPKH